MLSPRMPIEVVRHGQLNPFSCGFTLRFLGCYHVLSTLSLPFLKFSSLIHRFLQGFFQKIRSNEEIEGFAKMTHGCGENFQVFSALPKPPHLGNWPERRAERRAADGPAARAVPGVSHLVGLPLTKWGTNEAPKFCIHFNHIRSFIFIHVWVW